MEAEQILIAACAHVDCTPDRVLAHHIYDDYITLVVDRGIEGGPKYTVPLADLMTKQEPLAIEIKTVVGDMLVDSTLAALRLAEKHGVDLRTVTGSGTNGRILKKDVEAML